MENKGQELVDNFSKWCQWQGNRHLLVVLYCGGMGFQNIM